jgi:hypothetical protein
MRSAASTTWALKHSMLVDYARVMRSAPNEPRWRKNANWIRFALVREGVTRKDSHRGIGEISET